MKRKTKPSIDWLLGEGPVVAYAVMLTGAGPSVTAWIRLKLLFASKFAGASR